MTIDLQQVTILTGMSEDR